jgi:DNA-binding NarL/FixJ family response regulator
MLSPHESLTHRQFLVLLALAQGKRRKDIAAELHIDTRTVSTYRRRVLDVLGVHCNTDLTIYCRKRGMLI